MHNSTYYREQAAEYR